jgi:hypothetical protein
VWTLSEYVYSLGFVASLAYRLLGRIGELEPSAVAWYDRRVFPISRVLDRLTARWFGENLLLEAEHD